MPYEFVKDAAVSLDSAIHRGHDAAGQYLDRIHPRARSVVAVLGIFASASVYGSAQHTAISPLEAGVVDGVKWLFIPEFNAAMSNWFDGDEFVDDGDAKRVNNRFARWMGTPVRYTRLPLFVAGAGMMAAGAIEGIDGIVRAEGISPGAYARFSNGYLLASIASSSYIRDKDPKRFAKDPFWSRFKVPERKRAYAPVSLESRIEE